MKPVCFTLHAQAKLAERGIPPEWVEDVVRYPDWTDAEPHDRDAERRFGPVPAFGGRILRVVCVETDDHIRIVTATFDRGAKRP